MRLPTPAQLLLWPLNITVGLLEESVRQVDRRGVPDIWFEDLHLVVEQGDPRYRLTTRE